MLLLSLMQEFPNNIVCSISNELISNVMLMWSCADVVTVMYIVDYM